MPWEGTYLFLLSVALAKESFSDILWRFKETEQKLHTFHLLQTPVQITITGGTKIKESWNIFFIIFFNYTTWTVYRNKCLNNFYKCLL